MDLGDVHAGFCPERFANVFETESSQFGIAGTESPVFRGHLGEFFDVVPDQNPGLALGYQPSADIDFFAGISVGTRGVVQGDGGVGGGRVPVHRLRGGQADLPHGHADPGFRASQVHFPRGWERLGHGRGVSGALSLTVAGPFSCGVWAAHRMSFLPNKKAAPRKAAARVVFADDLCSRFPTLALSRSGSEGCPVCRTLSLLGDVKR